MYVVPQDKYDAFIAGACKGDIKYTRQINQLDVNDGGKVIIRNDDNIKNSRQFSQVTPQNSSTLPPSQGKNATILSPNLSNSVQSSTNDSYSGPLPHGFKYNSTMDKSQNESNKSFNKSFNNPSISPMQTMTSQLSPEISRDHEMDTANNSTGGNGSSTPNNQSYESPAVFFENANLDSNDARQLPAVMSSNPPRVFTPLSELTSNSVHRNPLLSDQSVKISLPNNSSSNNDSAILRMVPDNFFKNSQLIDMRDIMKWSRSRDNFKDIFSENSNGNSRPELPKLEYNDEIFKLPGIKARKNRLKNIGSVMRKKLASKKDVSFEETLKHAMAAKMDANGKINASFESPDVSMSLESPDVTMRETSRSEDNLPPIKKTWLDHQEKAEALKKNREQRKELRKEELKTHRREKRRDEFNDRRGLELKPTLEPSEKANKKAARDPEIEKQNSSRNQSIESNDKKALVKVSNPQPEAYISQLFKPRKRNRSPEISVKFSKTKNPPKKNKQNELNEYKSWKI